MGKGSSGSFVQTRPWSEAVEEFRSNTAKQSKSARFSRLHTLVPLGDKRNKNYSEKEPTYPPTETDIDRYKRHGWGVGIAQPHTITQRWNQEERNLQQTEEDLQARRRTIVKPVPGCGPGTGPNRPPFTGTRAHLFDHVTMNNPGVPEDDSWLGNTLINGNEGKSKVPVPGDGSGSLFEVLAHGESTGEGAAPDAWIGNRMVDPTKGKANPPDPASKQGRKNLFGIMHQKALEPGEPGHDAWLGHRLVNPAKGKNSTSEFIPKNRAGRKDLFGIIAHEEASFDDPKKPQGRMWAPGPESNPFNMFPIIQQTENGADNRDGGRKTIPIPRNYFGRTDLFATIQMNPAVREEVYPHGRKILPVPGRGGIGKGSTMLHHIAEPPGPQHVGRSGHISFNAASRGA